MELQLKKTDDELIENFFSLTTPEAVAELLEIPYKVLNYYLYILPTHRQYRTFKIAKKRSGVREICAPITPIKIIQKKLNHILQRVYRANHSAHGFVHKRSVRTNAKRHVKKEYVFNIDLANFFPSINFARVYGMFRSHPYSLPKGVASRLAAICCYKKKRADMGFLPQGAPTSPTVSNMICWRMDNQLYRLAKKYNCKYTRYADDITFSTDQHAFPTELAILAPFNLKDRLVASVGDELNEIIHTNGFTVNPNKVWIRHRTSRQQVTGLTVNEIPNVTRKFTNQTRAMLHDWKKNGPVAAEKKFVDNYDKKKRGSFDTGTLFRSVVKGKINFLKMVRGDQNSTYQKFCQQLACLDPAFSFVKIIRDTNQESLQEAVFVLDVMENEEVANQGSAFMVYPFGIVTSAHNVKNDKLNTFLYKVNEPNNRLRAIVKHIDSDTDVAILENTNNWAKHGFVLSSTDSIKIQDRIKLIGFPNHAEGKSIQIRDGKITHKSRWGNKKIEIINIDANIMFGNSGGPVLNDKHEVIGIAFWGAKDAVEVQQVECGVVPIDNVRRLVRDNGRAS